MQLLPVEYIEPVFRPPSEARSFILQVTNGCSWNRCTFCEMYTAPQKKFRPRKEQEVLHDIITVASKWRDCRRVFLADGDAMALSFRRLQQILQWLNEHFPELQRVSSYCLPRNLKNKTVEELQILRELKLDMLYVGAESGDDVVLEKVKKGETQASTIDALMKIKAAGIKSSVMILNGLGGTKYLEQHALNSAQLVNEAQPDYLATLVVSFPMGDQRLKTDYPEFSLPSQPDLFQEVQIFLEATQLQRTIFRSDHASNYLVLKGILNRDKEKLLMTVNRALNNPESVRLREEWQRGL